MSELNINVAGGSSTRLLTAGKYCDKDILIVASGSEAEPAVIEALEITANGTYTAPDGVDGYSPVTVNVAQDGGPPEEAFLVRGDCSYRFANGGWDWFINQHGSKITTENISGATNMFSGSKITELPFDFNFTDNGCVCGYMFSSCEVTHIPAIDFKQTNTYKTTISMFQSCYKLKSIGKMSNLYLENISYMFSACRNLRYLPEMENWNFSRIHSYSYSPANSLFAHCNSLRSIPETFVESLRGIWTSTYSNIFANFIQECSSLDEIRGLVGCTTSATSNMFMSTFDKCYRLKDVIFATDNGTPYVRNWKNQTIDLTSMVGFCVGAGGDVKNYILNYNSGITADKEVVDDATYQALKNDPDWFTCKIEYSRYNHDSAVNTINSLPDVSASGTGNIIKFRGAAGSLTDGGAINTLTEEEIAVAAAKGWTVTLV